MASKRRGALLRRLRTIRRKILLWLRGQRSISSDVAIAKDLVARLGELEQHLRTNGDLKSNISDSDLLSDMGKLAQFIRVLLRS